MSDDNRFEAYWKALNKVKPVTGDVVLTPEQFKKMQQQAYVCGYRAAVEPVKLTKDGKKALDSLWVQFDRLMAQMDETFKKLFGSGR